VRYTPFWVVEHPLDDGFDVAAKLQA